MPNFLRETDIEFNDSDYHFRLLRRLFSELVIKHFSQHAFRWRDLIFVPAIFLWKIENLCRNPKESMTIAQFDFWKFDPDLMSGQNFWEPQFIEINWDLRLLYYWTLLLYIRIFLKEVWAVYRCHQNMCPIFVERQILNSYDNDYHFRPLCRLFSELVIKHFS